jgi:TonB family protein
MLESTITRSEATETDTPKPPAPVQTEAPTLAPAPPRALQHDASHASEPAGVNTAASVTVGFFERSPGSRVSPVIHRPASAVMSGSFGSLDSTLAVEVARDAAVRSGGFDIKQAQREPVAAAPRQARIDTPLEILFKPAPGYTEEAKTLRIEGAVVLEVEFSAASDVRVLRVLSGLGHGLDEAAARAAGQIRFKPARSAGNPVDFRTTVHIVFRLT